MPSPGQPGTPGGSGQVGALLRGFLGTRRACRHVACPPGGGAAGLAVLSCGTAFASAGREARLPLSPARRPLPCLPLLVGRLPHLFIRYLYCYICRPATHPPPHTHQADASVSSSTSSLDPIIQLPSGAGEPSPSSSSPAPPPGTPSSRPTPALNPLVAMMMSDPELAKKLDSPRVLQALDEINASPWKTIRWVFDREVMGVFKDLQNLMRGKRPPGAAGGGGGSGGSGGSGGADSGPGGSA